MRSERTREPAQGLARGIQIISFSVLYLLCCLPVLTAGAASIAMSAAMRRLKEGEAVTYSGFFRDMRRYFRQGCVLFLTAALCAAVTVVSFASYRRFDPISWPLYLTGVGMGTLCLLVIPWLFPCAGYFETDSFHMVVFAYYLSVKHLGYTALLGLLLYGLLYVGVLTLVFLPVVPGIILYLQAGTFSRIFRRYDRRTLQALPNQEDGPGR